jgi:putative ubiquitin-RnfH superfamily antitoxin RatB of RatAB toxin-antitoxin module
MEPDSTMATPESVCVEVCYASPGAAIIRTYRLPQPACLADALAAAAADPAFAGIDLGGAVGVFGRVAIRSTPLAEGDRVEVYRPLAADPKSARRARARQSNKR